MPVAPQIGSKAEEICHYAGVRLRVTGAGNLRMTLFSLDDERSNVLAPLAMQATTGREPTRLANFTSQRAMLEIKITAIDEKFVINRIIIFEKTVWSQYPG